MNNPILSLSPENLERFASYGFEFKEGGWLDNPQHRMVVSWCPTLGLSMVQYHHEEEEQPPFLFFQGETDFSIVFQELERVESYLQSHRHSLTN